jgi:hypothetical protein
MEALIGFQGLILKCASENLNLFLMNWLRVLGTTETPYIDQGIRSGKEVISLPPPPLRTVHTRHRVHGSSNRRTPRGALLL